MAAQSKNKGGKMYSKRCSRMKLTGVNVCTYTGLKIKSPLYLTMAKQQFHDLLLPTNSNPQVPDDNDLN